MKASPDHLLRAKRDIAFGEPAHQKEIEIDDRTINDSLADCVRGAEKNE
jgi:hypothetical protein